MTNFAESNYLRDEEISRGGFNKMNFLKEKYSAYPSPSMTTTSAKLTSSFSNSKFSKPNELLFPSRPLYYQVANNLNMSNENNVPNLDLANTESLKTQIIQNINGNENFLKKLEDFSERLKSSILKNEKLELPAFKSSEDTSTKAYSPLDLYKQYNKLSTRVYYKAPARNFTVPTNKLNNTSVQPKVVQNNIPMLYKLKINDSIAKNLLENQSLRSKLGMKPNDKISILIKRPLEEEQKTDMNQEFFMNNQNALFLQNLRFQPINLNQRYKTQYALTPAIGTTTSTLSWLSKLKAKLSHTFSPTTSTLSTTTTTSASSLPVKNYQKSQVNQVTNNAEWTHVLSDQYKKGMNCYNVEFSFIYFNHF